MATTSPVLVTAKLPRRRSVAPFAPLALALALAAGCGGTSSSVGDGDAGRPENPGDAGTTPEASTPKNACGQSLLETNADASQRGPWAVGAKRTKVGELTVEIWYPAEASTAAGKPKLSYDIRDNLSSDQAAKIKDADNPLQPCECHRDLPLDTAHGPYPVIVFVHGTAGFMTQNLANVVHWASRGFVVAAANHPGLDIGSLVNGQTGPKLRDDVTAELAALKSASGDLAMFAGHLDLAHVGLAGHSAGGNGVAGMADLPGVGVVIPLSAGNASPAKSVLYVGGRADTVVAFDTVKRGYDQAKPRKRLVGIDDAGHTGVTSLCGIKNAKGQDIVKVAQDAGVLTGLLASFAPTLFDCAKNKNGEAVVVPIVNDVTTSAFEETLQCRASSTAALTSVKAKYPPISIYEEGL